jgi:hypothetical protein
MSLRETTLKRACCTARTKWPVTPESVAFSLGLDDDGGVAPPENSPAIPPSARLALAADPGAISY